MVSVRSFFLLYNWSPSFFLLYNWLHASNPAIGKSSDSNRHVFVMSMQRLFALSHALAAGNGEAEDAAHGQFLATVPEEPEDDEEPAGAAGGQGDCMHEHLAGDAVTQAGFCRDHRGKLQSVWELREDDADVADHEDEGGGEDEADRASRAAAVQAAFMLRVCSRGV